MRNLLLFPLVLSSAGHLALAQPTAPDSARPRPWLLPQHVIGQAAAGQGMVAAGLGYTLLAERLDFDLLAGYVPAQYSITAMGIFTAKATYSPWRLPLGATRWRLRPLSAGGFISYTASEGLNKTRTDRYERGYYWWSAHTRVGGFVGSQLAYRLPGRPRRPTRFLSAYYELGTNDLYLSSMWHNIGYLPLSSILTLGVGLKLDLP